MTLRAGLVAGLRVGLPFGVVFEVGAVAAGFDPWPAGAFSALVGAGAVGAAVLAGSTWARGYWV